MTRQKLGPKKIKILCLSTGLPIHAAFARGGTNHTLLLCLKDGRVFHLYKDGSLQFQNTSTYKCQKETDET
jgi:hypothetical protein